MIVDVARVHVCCDYNFKVGELFFRKLQTNLIRLLRREFILI